MHDKCERVSNKILVIPLCPIYLFIALFTFFAIAISRVDASANIDLINSWGGVNNSCANCSYLNTSNFNGFGFQKTSFIFDEAYIDISFSGILSAQSNNAASLNVSSYMVTLKGSTNQSNITNWCSISYHNESRYEDHYSVGFDIHCTGQVHGNNWDLVIIDFYLNQRSTAGLVSAENFVVQAVTDSSAINSTINNSTNSIINNNNNNTDKVIDNQNKNTQDIIDSNNQTNEKLDDLNDFFKDDTPPDSDISSLGNVTGLLPPGPLDSLLNLPFQFLSIIVSSLGEICTPLEMDFVYDSKLTLPCLSSTIYDNMPSGLMVFVNLIPTTFLLIVYFKHLYKKVERATSLETNSDDEWGCI